MKNNILQMEAELINNGENIETTVMFDGDFGNVLKSISLGVNEILDLMCTEEAGIYVTKRELYKYFLGMLKEDVIIKRTYKSKL